MRSKPIKRVTFIEPKPPGYHIFSRYPLPRLGSVLLATILRNRGYETRVFVEEIGSIDQNFASKSDIICISSITSTVNRAYKLAEHYREKGIPVVMGGPHPSALPEEALKFCDFVIRGEGEKALEKLIKASNEGNSLEEISNLSYKKDGKFIHNPIAPMLSDLDSLPSPDFSLISGWKLTKNTIIPIMTSRGCPYKCDFCAVITIFGTKFRTRSVKLILEEIGFYQEKSNFIFFYDDNFAADKRRTKELLKGMIDAGFKNFWSAQVRVEAAKDEELLELMRKSHCSNVYVGLESINPKALEQYNKAQTVEDIETAIRNFHRANIRVHGMFVLGSDYDNYKTVRETFRFAKRLKIDTVQFMLLTPLPGTPFHRKMCEEGRILTHNWSQYDGHHTVYKPMWMTPYELQIEMIKTMAKFYNLRNALKRLIRVDFRFFLLRLYGKFILKNAKKTLKGYINQLYAELVNKYKYYKEKLLPKRKIISIGLPGVLFADEYRLYNKMERNFLCRFFQKLGIKVIVEDEKLENSLELKDKDRNGDSILNCLIGQICKIQNRVDIILVPLNKAYEWLSEAIKEKIKNMGKNCTNIIIFPWNLKSCEFYNSCIEVGLLFNSSIRRLRKAFFSAMVECEAGLQF